MGQAKRKAERKEELAKTLEGTLESDVVNDMQLEEEFNKALGKKRPDLIKSELEQAIMVLNEQTEAMMRWRFDLGTFLELEALEPWNNDWKEKKKNAILTLKSRRVTLKAIRDQIVTMLEKNGKV